MPEHAEPTLAAKPWFVYLVRAENGALYCGISDDPQRRFAQHCSGKGARFFHSSPAQALVFVEACADKGEALRREIAIKRMKKAAKEVLIQGWEHAVGVGPSEAAG
ncbi:GIY-YIG nuclease family protein [Pseudomonas sp. Q1-7]|uniref:GIY-YIG nuclease family protein n=1 Tax=Pseudomonas sp. Q1-7 TaxID=3020843 RepID=UPI002300F3E5|nr:GIY-YIG nuclease family protein [Pseudomonas sp. Q1-7]